MSEPTKDLDGEIIARQERQIAGLRWELAAAEERAAHNYARHLTGVSAKRRRLIAAEALKRSRPGWVSPVASNDEFDRIADMVVEAMETDSVMWADAHTVQVTQESTHGRNIVTVDAPRPTRIVTG